jgi:hypothetical protein
MKHLSNSTRRRIARGLTWSGFAALTVSAYFAYRWAEPSPDALRAVSTGGTGNSATIRLDDTPFAGYLNGARTWSLHAGQVNILRLPNTSLTNVQSASIVDIRDGALYDPPRAASPGATPVATHVMEAGAPAANSGPISATFHAKTGRYSAGMLEAAPADLEMLYTVQWQFKLSGDVVFRTRAKDQLSAPSMTIYTLVNRRTGKPEQRIICDQGGKMTHQGVGLTANTIRFNPKDRTVECLSGVRGTFKSGNVQAERVFWSLDDETLRCPETAAGTVQGMPFIALGLTLDVKHRKHHAKHIHLDINLESLSRNEE